jgi:L-alanine-DL-glutamate epimerase-like enolase superfamily enzyme
MTRASDDVTVEEVIASAYRIPTDAPESDGTLEWDSTVLVVVEATAGGCTGIGYTYAHPAVVSLIESTLAGVVCGRDAMTVRAAWAAMLHETRNLGTVGVVAMAISAVDTALWDLYARLCDLPLCVALGAVHDDVPIYGSGGFTSYDDAQLSAQLSDWVESGIPRVKVKTGRDPADDPRRLRVAREAIGADVELFADANGAFTVRQAVGWATVYRDEHDVRWFEEPVSSDDLAGLRHVRRQAPGGIDVTAGEYGWTPWYFERMLAAEAVDCLQADPTRCLGFTGFLAAAELADGHQSDLSAHCAPQLSAQACTAVRRLRHLEYFHDHVRIERLAFDGILEPAAGGVLRPDRSRVGNGLSLKRTDLEDYRVR